MWIKVVKPSFATLFPASEVLFITDDEEFSCYLVPFIAIRILPALNYNYLIIENKN